MKITDKLINVINPPCARCPYTLKEVYFVTNPCPECKRDNYSMYKELTRRGNGFLNKSTHTDN